MLPENTKPIFRVGDTAIICGGPLAGRRCRILESGKRYVVDVRLFGDTSIAPERLKNIFDAAQESCE